MSSTTQKHRDFINEPMGNKSVTAIPGIEEGFAADLRARNIDKACFILIYKSFMTI